MAGFSDRTIKGITITAIGLYAAVLICGLALRQLLLFVAVTNAITAIAIICYCIWDAMHPVKRLIERRMLIVVLLELLFLSFALYIIISGSQVTLTAVVQYIIFASHALLLLLFLIFMFTFKIKKLF